jgi:hypothetical protein
LFSFLFAFLIVCAVTVLAIFGSERWGVAFLVLLGFALGSCWVLRRVTGPIRDNSPMGGYGSYLAHEFFTGYLMAVAVSLAGLLWYRARTQK